MWHSPAAPETSLQHMPDVILTRRFRTHQSLSQYGMAPSGSRPQVLRSIVVAREVSFDFVASKLAPSSGMTAAYLSTKRLYYFVLCFRLRGPKKKRGGGLPATCIVGRAHLPPAERASALVRTQMSVDTFAHLSPYSTFSPEVSLSLSIYTSWVR